MKTPVTEKDKGADRFTFGEGTIGLDEDGKEMTPRQIMEEQLNRCRAEVDEDLPADTATRGQ